MCLLIGYGSSLRCDDGLGPYLAETLGHPGSVITTLQLLPELAEVISRVQRCVFLDARQGDRPGKIFCEKVIAAPANAAFTHNVTPSSLLAMAHQLYGAAPKALLITVTGASFAYDTHLSPQLRANLPHITSTIQTMLKVFCKTKALI